MIRDGVLSHRLIGALYIGLGAILLIPSLAAMYVGWFSRYMADDYCTVGVLRDFGFSQSQVYWYTTWSGRFAFTFFVNVAELIGPGVVRLLPAATMPVGVLMHGFVGVVSTIIPLSMLYVVMEGSGYGKFFLNESFDRAPFTGVVLFAWIAFTVAPKPAAFNGIER